MTISERVEVLRIAADLAMAAASQGNHSTVSGLKRKSAAEGGSAQDDLSLLVSHYFDHLTGLLGEAGKGA